MTRQLFSQGSAFEDTIGYSRAVRDGRWVHVSGTTGFNYADMTISDDPAQQADQTFRNIDSALRAVGASISDIVRVTYIVPNRDDFEPCFPVLSSWLGDVRPAATMFMAGLYDPRMKIEIEVTARIAND
ncbi:Enamine deaminase RidA, house cleaning of reactive enamine intermediates, YjgF/YER057c/UK114 family [Monaibacterium marinum]|uniref:Enamine deaminase RidA, house cleaning of reactive enamine intermediates, YjgF/YER057c/UK114 family n=1 Tax=Pontivivens marinum TaxID=1690039 RepID=A0A2C9CM21_9RHOB|nr:RidA family protein [Monaibacterium marinum]SOH92235.1 Enamine deaminase RidA, house cleaning of reactive enamine intermediates, YjgF/YER057c/UK114 family [Monaibacterium marinum]